MIQNFRWATWIDPRTIFIVHRVVIIRNPLGGIPGHIQHVIGTATVGVTADRNRMVLAILKCVRVSSVPIITPRVNTTIRTTSGFLPFRLCGKPLPHPPAEAIGDLPGHT
jgi:hypothetical protein